MTKHRFNYQIHHNAFAGRYRRWLSAPGTLFLIIAASALSGCGTTDESTEGAAWGGLAGGAAGAYLGKSPEAAAIGTAAGGAIGYAAGSYYQSEREKYETAEDLYDAELQKTKDQVSELKSYAAKLEQENDRLEREAVVLASNYQSGQATSDEVRSEVELLEEQRSEAQERLSKARQFAENEKAVLANVQGEVDNVEEFEAEIAALEDVIEAIEEEIQRLTGMRDDLTV